VGNLAVVNDGAAYKLPQSESRLNGAQAITRTNDTMVHQFPWYTPGAFGSGSVVFKGTWKTITLQRNLLWFYERWNSVNNPSGSPAGNSSNQDKNKCVLDQMPAGPVHDCKLENGSWIPDTSKPNVFSAVVDKIQKQSSVPEWVTYLFSIDEDFGDAPRSYDADNGASHVLSDLRIGGIVDSVGLERALASGEVNNIGTTGIVSPNAGGTDRSDDGFINAPDVPATGNYSVTVPVSGVSQNAKLCGWVDANASGTFDANERQCVNVSANDTSSVLTWPESFANSITSPTYMRLRLSYDVTGVESPLGRLASGEVEDWQVRRASATEAPSGSASSSRSKSKTGNKVDQLPRTGGSTQMVLPSVVGLFLGGMILVSRQRRLRRSQ
jgi:LPXTG-motif cell wall-anchored protein